MRNEFYVLWMLCVAVMLPGVGYGAGAGDQAVIVRDGKPMAVIVVPDEPGRAEPFAAGELQKYIEKISGARLEIIAESALQVDEEIGPDSSRIFIGRTKAARQLQNILRRRDADAFAVKIERQQIGGFVRPGQWDDHSGSWHDLFLVGADDRGTVYAVYDFLERELGCRWLAPGERWEDIPANATIVAPLRNRIEAPVFKYRQDNSLDRGDWGMKLKANVCRRTFWPFEWMPERYHDVAHLPFELRGWQAVHDAPRIVWGVNRNNPEWFALNHNNQRWVGGETDDYKGHMCFSNPEVHDLLAERLSQLFRERPDLEFVEIGCADGLSAKYCRCDGCMDWDAMGSINQPFGVRGTHTYRWLMLVNAVADRLAESDPGKKLVAAAYASYQEPPDATLIQPADNVIIMYWTWSNCRVHGYEHAEEDDNRLPDMESHAQNRRWMEAWHAITPGGLFMSEYVSRASMDGVVGVNPRRFIADMRYLNRNGFVGYNAFDGPIPWGMQILNRYAILKAMWDPELDADELVRDFCDHAFRAGSADMQEFIKTIENAMQMAGCSHVASTSWVQPETVAQARRHLAAAQAAAAGDETALVRMREIEWHFEYAALSGPACELWFRVVKGERDPEMMREAIRLGEAALAYRDEMLKAYPDELFRSGWRMSRNHLGSNQSGSWYRLLRQLERESK